MNRWRIVIEAWPYFGVEQAAAGDRSQTFYVNADGARHAFTLAEHIAKGMEASPAIWQAPIQSVGLDRPMFHQNEVPPVGSLEISAIKTAQGETK